MSKFPNPIRLWRECPVTHSQQPVYIYWLEMVSGDIRLAFNGCEFSSSCAACSHCEKESLAVIRSAPDDYLPRNPVVPPTP